MQNEQPGKQLNTDLPDSKKDQAKLKPDVTIIDMPEVKDIPGQENITVPDMREMQDTTISSADEEAEDLLASINTDEETPDADGAVTNDERTQPRKGNPVAATKKAGGDNSIKKQQ
ncbi:MAG: hypothetical protein EOO04_09585 [Chitinophagaceae bacterium]|nr:MAG: hypothetical protein EOO04_09585 [Chitinophagaceae bacterium]